MQNNPRVKRKVKAFNGFGYDDFKAKIVSLKNNLSGIYFPAKRREITCSPDWFISTF